MEFKHTTDLIDSVIYPYYLEQIKSLKKHYLTIGYSLPMAEAFTHFELDTSAVIWAEQEGKPVGLISYKNEPKWLDQRVMSINFIKAENSVYEQLYKFFEGYAKNLGCAMITEAVVLKDIKRIEAAEQAGLKKDFYFLFKKVA